MNDIKIGRLYALSVPESYGIPRYIYPYDINEDGSYVTVKIYNDTENDVYRQGVYKASFINDYYQLVEDE